jgi:hypothetical protein
MLCISGYGQSCDQTSFNDGWAMDLSLGDADWDYAYQSAPNHHTEFNNQGFAVAGWDQTSHDNNAAWSDAVVRIWVREHGSVGDANGNGILDTNWRD